MAGEIAVDLVVRQAWATAIITHEITYTLTLDWGKNDNNNISYFTTAILVRAVVKKVVVRKASEGLVDKLLTGRIIVTESDGCHIILQSI